MILCRVMIDERAEKQLVRIPGFIKNKLYQWVERVEALGIDEVRKIKGFHDEPLQGKRAGQRSIRLNRSYRAIYFENEEGVLLLITVLEVNKHEY